MHGQPQDRGMARNILARGAVGISSPLQPQEQFRRMQHVAAKRVVQRANLGSEPRLGSEVAQDHMACRIGHETGRRIVRHQPEGKISCRLAAVSGEMCASRKRQRKQHQHDPDEGRQWPAFAQKDRPDRNQAQPRRRKCQEAIPPAAIHVHPTQYGSPGPACAPATMRASG